AQALRVTWVQTAVIHEFHGLKKTITTMDKELPRSELSINNRNELRNVLHLHSLYKQNKAKENPLKTLLEIITNYFLEHRGTSRSTGSSSALSTPQSKSSASHPPDLLDEDHGNVSALDESKTQASRYSLIYFSLKHQHRSEKCHTGTTHSSNLPTACDKKLKDSREDLKAAAVSEEMKSTGKEKSRPKAGLIARGMMAGPVASPPEDPSKRRLSRRSTSTSSTAQPRGEEQEDHDTDLQESKASPTKSSVEFASKAVLSSHTSSASEKPRNSPKDPDDFFSRLLSERERAKTEERKSLPSSGADSSEKSLKVNAPHRHSGTGREKKERSLRKTESRLSGHSLCCFSEEWKIQSFTFSNIPQLKYGIVQKKGGPCGVLAAVQACVLQQLIFADTNRNKDTRCLQPSEAHRTKCLSLALADVLWRAGGHEKALVALPSGRQQFTPTGKYKADGILETVRLCVTPVLQIPFLFETGPYGCILLTVSVILSRSINLVRNDFDVLTNRLIGSHGYCTQELVNLLLTGKAVSNVFNNVIELDSGNGNITILKGITSRSDIGLLSLFEHYDVCQVGCYLKTPKYPIWLVCSESHFSVLFCLEKDLLSDWKTGRRFDLYYYDGLANQDEEIRLTVGMSISLTLHFTSGEAERRIQ
uniref:Ubiquitin carboxyl-terminal hydrolase MINDY n=1 Tax=Zosterops lateralis melanops TaxID=1220523 RepID=A0A8D2QTZ0_ZOSLA